MEPFSRKISQSSGNVETAVMFTKAVKHLGSAQSVIIPEVALRSGQKTIEALEANPSLQRPFFCAGYFSSSFDCEWEQVCCWILGDTLAHQLRAND